MKILPHHRLSLSMGESGSRRSTLVSRLPIFRRSNCKRQDSLPSSPSSGGNCAHTSSPSSTNSSSGSTGKRRSLFRAPSLSFSAKRSSNPRVQPVNLNLTSPSVSAQTTDANGNSQQPTTASQSGGFSEAHTKSRHSFGFGSYRQKKITRSQTEDFDKASASSSTNNRNVFINCLSGSTANEGDDSGFIEDYGNGRSSRHKKHLLPKSLSAHHRFPHQRPPGENPESPGIATVTPGTGGLTPASCPSDVGLESSLQSPMVSEDRTTAITPSEFIPITEDSVSEAEALPAPSPGPILVSGPITDTAATDGQPVQETISSSQAPLGTEKPLLPETSTANNTDYETAVSLSEPETAVPCSSPRVQLPDERDQRKEKEEVADRGTSGKKNTETTSESEAGPPRSDSCRSYPEQSERRTRHTLSVHERGTFCGCREPRSCHIRKPHTASLCSSVSPYHEVMRLERRLRSSSEGAGGPRIHSNHRDTPGMEGCGLLKHRNNSSSSKLGSLDVLNNLGSSELDEDDLMLDLDLSDDQRHRYVSRQDSSQSLASCLNLLHSPIDQSGDRIPVKDNCYRELRRPTSLLPGDCSSAMLLGREDEPLPPGVETLPWRLMQQDCTAVKTLLLRLRRTLQESTETSPASSLQSLPISPCSEKSLPFKDWNREEALLQQLKEKDELILRLQSELESAKALKMKDGRASDRATQTEHMGLEVNNHSGRPGPGSSSNSSPPQPKDRRAARAGVAPSLLPHAGDPANSSRHPLSLGSAREENYCNPPVGAPNMAAHSFIPAAQPRVMSSLTSRQPDRVSSSSESLGGSLASRKGEQQHISHIPRAVGASSSSLASRGSISSSGIPSPQKPSSTSSSSSSSTSSPFTGRLGQPPRGPLSLHSYSRKNVFLQHSLHTTDLQTLTQRDA
ncbi:serine-rich coiled-coil domain-containing protein 1 isoform X1 [Corythoichthys intestinalis]|uniref:serine-rich coiled-coil domain-containing protein 1 isoform X1 n=2 Tax=Corythoichthys intestinalis TaxID=161448 RepID=UPI0025A67524|nr:serine-rich coiled-coil domain-containing protein 1 isoform X1 [Corythoichthys intestinalis]